MGGGGDRDGDEEVKGHVEEEVQGHVEEVNVEEQEVEEEEEMEVEVHVEEEVEVHVKEEEVQEEKEVEEEEEDEEEEVEEVSLTPEQLADHLAFMEGLGQEATDKGYMPPMDIMEAYGVDMDPTSDPSTVTVREEEPGEPTTGRVPPPELSIDELHAKGNTAMKEEDYVSALDMYTEALETIYTSGSPCHKLHVLFANRSAAQLKLGDAKSAAEDAESAVSANPKYTKGWYRLASAYALQDNAAAMLEAVRKGLELEPTNRELLEMRKGCPGGPDR